VFVVTLQYEIGQIHSPWQRETRLTPLSPNPRIVAVGTSAVPLRGRLCPETDCNDFVVVGGGGGCGVVVVVVDSLGA
jgi:hypothetical protein